MNLSLFWSAFDARVAKYDLLSHPFYQAWSAGELTQEDLQVYAAQYYRHVEAFPGYLAQLEERLPEGQMRIAIARNRMEELGAESKDGCTHAELWLDFAAGIGAQRVSSYPVLPQIGKLVDSFDTVAETGDTVEALAAFCAYESQVPRIATEKISGLKRHYGANDKTCRYFTVHQTADVLHTAVWRALIESEVVQGEEKMNKALMAAELAAKQLWVALDGIEAERHARSKQVQQRTVSAA